MLRISDGNRRNPRRSAAPFPSMLRPRPWRECMFELLVVACINGRICEYVQTPALYATEQVCAQQAAIIAGMVHGRYDTDSALSYRYSCHLGEYAGQPAAAPSEPAISGQTGAVAPTSEADTIKQI